MSTSTMPPVDWRRVYPGGPPDVRLEIGPWCPLGDCRLEPTTSGWVCRVCAAGWSFYGRDGRWLDVDARWPVRARWAAVVAGGTAVTAAGWMIARAADPVLAGVDLVVNAVVLGLVVVAAVLAMDRIRSRRLRRGAGRGGAR